MEEEIIKEVSQYLAAFYLLVDKTFYKELDRYSDDYLKNLIKVLQCHIEISERDVTLPKTMKNNIYNLLSVIRSRLTDLETLEEINRLIRVLNTIDDSNAGKYLYYQFELRFDGPINKNYMKEIDETNVWQYENKIYDAIMNDYPFFCDLVHDDLGTFFEKYIGNTYALTSISFLLKECPEILSIDKIYMNLYGFLYWLYKTSKLKNTECEFDEGVKILSIPDEISKQTKYCMKLLKKQARRY